MTDVTAEQIVDFWFPDGPEPTPKDHMDWWMWRMRGGAHEDVIARFTDVTHRAIAGDFDHWAETPEGRMALIIIFDQFTRSVFAGTPDAFAQDGRAAALCLEGLENGHFDALPNVWQKTAFKIPLEHWECPDHLANVERAVAIAEAIADDAPEHLREFYRKGAEQPGRHRDVIARFGRHPHRNEILGRDSTPEEVDYIATGAFPHQRDFSKDLDDLT